MVDVRRTEEDGYHRPLFGICLDFSLDAREKVAEEDCGAKFFGEPKVGGVSAGRAWTRLNPCNGRCGGGRRGWKGLEGPNRNEV